MPRAISAFLHGVELGAGEHAVEQPLPDAPFLERVELDRQLVLDLVEELADADPEPVAQERFDRVLDEPHEVVELDHGVRAGWQRRRQERLVELAGPRQRPCARERLDGRSSTVRSGTSLPGDEVPRIERLERMVDHDLIARRAVLAAHRPIDDVEQLADRNGRRATQVRALVVRRCR